MNYPFLEYIEEHFDLRSNFKKFNTKKNFTNLSYIYSNTPLEKDEPFYLDFSNRISFSEKYPVEFIVLNNKPLAQDLSNNSLKAFIYIKEQKENYIKYKTKDNTLLSDLEVVKKFPNEDFFDLFKSGKIKEVKFFNYYLLDLSTKEVYCFERESGKTFNFPFKSLKEYEDPNNHLKTQYCLSLEKLKSHRIYSYLEKFLDASEELNDLLTNKKHLEEYIIPEDKKGMIYILDKKNFLINEFIYHKDWLLKEEVYFQDEDPVEYLVLNKNISDCKGNIINIDRNRMFNHPISYKTLQEAQKVLEELKENQINALKEEIDSIISNYENKLPELLKNLKKLEHK